MDTRKFMPAGIDVSLLGMGCMRLPTREDETIDTAAAKGMIRQLLDAGVNYFDTAYGYHNGESEKFVGIAFEGVERGSYLLASKMPTYLLTEGGPTPEALFEEQLQRCNTGYFDFYLMHTLSKENLENMKRSGAYEYAMEQKRAGRIRYLGFSFHDDPEVLETICNEYQWDFAQIQLNYLDWEGYRSREQYEILTNHNIPVIIMEPVRGGSLADLGPEANAILKKAAPGRSIASWAMRYAASLPNVLTVLSGMSTPEQVRDNLATYSPFQPLTGAERVALDEALNLYRNEKTIPCTNCRYCMPCPAGVNIPGIFREYNKGLNIHSFLSNYRQEWPEAERAKNCVDCGQCVAVCPQHIAIPRLMNRIEAEKEPMLG